jgi:hypothetical protein
MGFERGNSSRGPANFRVGGLFHLRRGAILSVVDTRLEATA